MSPGLSANLGFLFTELPFLERIRAARAAGFDAVEFHDQAQSVAAPDLAAALRETRLPVVGLNVFMGETAGQAALVGGEAEFRAHFRSAARVADAVGADFVHATAGRAVGAEARSAYLDNLRFALQATTRIVVIEPLCPNAAPGYHLPNLEDAEAVLAAVDHPRLALMFDWFHIATLYGPEEALRRLRRLGPKIAHIQLASLPDRREPLPEALPELSAILEAARALRLRFVGLEYRPSASPALVCERLKGEAR